MIAISAAKSRACSHNYRIKNPPQVILSPSTVNGDGSITSPPLESHCIISASCAGSGVDEDVGVAASIRIVNAQKLKKGDFLRSGTAADEMMELMSALVRYGVSTTVAGATSSGKTTLTGWLLTTIPHDKRVFTIENGSRELDLVERDESGKNNKQGNSHHHPRKRGRKEKHHAG